MLVAPWSEVQSIIWLPLGMVGLFNMKASPEVALQLDWTFCSAVLGASVGSPDRSP